MINFYYKIYLFFIIQHDINVYYIKSNCFFLQNGRIFHLFIYSRQDC